MRRRMANRVGRYAGAQRVPLLAAASVLALGCQPGLLGPDPSGVGPGPLEDLPLFVERDSPAAQQVEAWRSSRPQDASYLTRIADEANAIWFGDWNQDVTGAVRHVVRASTAAGAIPVLVAYNIPQRDCGSYSAGGASDGGAYLDWVRDFARGLSGGRAIVVLEPDATASLDCLSASGRTERLGLLSQAVSLLSAEGARVYLDAGHPFWKTAGEMATLLRAAGVDAAAGFALNVSNYHPTAANMAYGESLSRLLGGARFVIDTSRNGIGTADPADWCNAPGQALGDRPRINPGPPLVDAYLWIKRPGESDGTCNGGPMAGQWWAEYALGLAQRQPVALAAGS